MALYFCESSGARIIKDGVGISQLGDNYQASLETWDLIPAGEVGDCYFRSIDVSGSVTNGYSIGVTPVVDGVEQAEQVFSASGSGPFQAQAFISARGTRIAAQVRTVSRTGEVELHNVAAAFLPIRAHP